MYCKNCGYVLDDKIAVCPVCGAKVMHENMEQISNASYGAGSESVGTETAVAASGVEKAAVAGAGKAVTTAVGKGIAAKIGIAIAAIAVAGGGFAGVAHYVSRRNSDNDAVKTATVAETGADDEPVATETATDGTNEENAASTEENQTEAVVSEQDERYAAYYEVTKEYMEKYPMLVEYGFGSVDAHGLTYADIVDFAGDGSGQLVISYTEEDIAAIELNRYTYTPHYLEVYDYQDGEVVQLLKTRTSEMNACPSIIYAGDGKKIWLCVYENYTSYEPYTGEDVECNQYEYQDGRMISTKNAANKNGEYTVDGGTVDEAAYEAAIQMMNSNKNEYEIDFWGNGYGSVNTYLEVKKLLLKKNMTIDTLAAAANDIDFTEKEDALVIDTGSGITSYNKYNECYTVLAVENYDNDGGIYVADGGINVSASGNAIQDVYTLVDSQSGEYVISYDFCMRYENGALFIEGFESRWYADFDYTQDSDVLNGELSECSITSEEYEQKVQELMNE